MTIIDISPSLSPALPVWPGDTEFFSTRTWTLAGACPVNVSMVRMSTHAGAHADAPLHYDPDGASIAEVDLLPYIGPCTVVHVTGARHVLSRETLVERVGGRDLQPRVLLRFYERAPQDRWDPAFPAVSARAVHFLAEHGAVLIGVDTASLDPQSSKIMEAHVAAHARNLRILEGLVLDAVAEGDYELIAPPLKLQGLDAAPVRAVLRTL